MNQTVFNLLLNPSVKGMLYKLLLKMRELLLTFNPDASVLYQYKQFSLKFPFSHDYPINKKHLTTYSENLGVIAQIVGSKYPNTTAIDVGANIGDSAAIIQSFIDMPILCIEGNPKFIPILRHNRSQLKNITIAEYFVGESNESVSAINTGGTARLISASGGSTTKTMSEILAAYASFEHAKLLKIDTDGFDNKIIRASTELLKQAKPILFFEYDPFFLKQANEQPADIFSYLESLGYTKLVLFDNLGKLLCTTETNQSNLLSELTAYYDNYGHSYLDICALHKNDEDLVSKIKAAFANH